MRKRILWIAPAAILAMAAFVALGGEVVKLLWHWLLPAAFGWRLITFWQALALLALCRILFGRMGGPGFSRSNFRRRMDERWQRMTPEEREKFRQGWRARCAGFEPPEAKPAP